VGNGTRRKTKERGREKKGGEEMEDGGP